jgi:3-deoxy-manno-octulosonate cytidylyltransferase (CMP-KDO synthetase)
VAIVPARMGSERFPGKVLADRTGWPLIRHVCGRAAEASSVGRVVVATDDDRVRAAVEGFGGEVGVEVVMTGEHPNGTSRLAEAARVLGLGADEVVVNVQGDEPELEPGLIDLAVEALVSGSAPMATVAAPMAEGEDPADPNVVKVVRRVDGTALYFSRSVVPFVRGGAPASAGRGNRGAPAVQSHDRWHGALRHVGLYAYRRSFLETYVSLAPTPLEQCERLEQLRVLEHGHAIAVALAPAGSGHAGIDTPEQYGAFVRRWEEGAGARRHGGRE